MTAIKAFIFDLDGVITDTAELHYQAWKQLTTEENIPFSREVNEHLRGLSRRASLEFILRDQEPPPEATMQAWMERKNIYYRELLQTITPEHTLPGVVEFLQSARGAGIRLGIGSASRNARDVLASLELLDLFDTIGDGYSVVNSKPAPDLFVWVAGALGVAPPEAVVFEDAEAGVAAALAAGFWTVGIGAERVQRAHFVVGGLAELTPAQVIERISAAARTNPG
jgi:beta-phosphoglucomutase